MTGCLVILLAVLGAASALLADHRPHDDSRPRAPGHDPTIERELRERAQKDGENAERFEREPWKDSVERRLRQLEQRREKERNEP